MADPRLVAHVQMEVEVREAWSRGEVVGWEDRGLPTADTQTALDLEAFQTEEELEAVGKTLLDH